MVSAMLIYKSVYRLEEGFYLGEVVDFPGTVAAGKTLEKARNALTSALTDTAETSILRGEPLPVPNPMMECHEYHWVEQIRLAI
jgi:predicted RNase H-like HicB family nuclease